MSETLLFLKPSHVQDVFHERLISTSSMGPCAWLHMGHPHLHDPNVANGGIRKLFLNYYVYVKIDFHQSSLFDPNVANGGIRKVFINYYVKK